MLRWSLLLIFATACAQTSPEPPARPPNVVIIFTDDQGYADVGVYGAEGFETPNLDRMAAEGMRFTSFYVAQSVCSASRAALLTGCYPNRFGISGALGPRAEHGLPPEEVTIAEICKSRDYATAIYGKWHLGHQPGYLPLSHGFDEFLGIPYSNDMWPQHPAYADLPPDAVERKRGYPELPLYEGNRIVDPEITGDEQAQFTRRFTARAVDLIERNRERPFFLYLAHPMPHVPLFVSEDFEARSEQGLYGDVIPEIDHSVGEVLAALERTGLDENTLVIFTSDNGPWLSYGNHAGSTGPLREGKGSSWEGGVRVPMIVRWPGRVPAGTVSDEPAMTIDLLPTVAGFIGATNEVPEIDGKDLAPLLTGQPGAVSPHDALYFYYRRNDLEAIRSGRWKLVLPHRYRSLTGEPGRDGKPHGYTQEECGLELYDLESDIGEEFDLSAEHPEIVARLERFAERAREDLGDGLTKREGNNRRVPKR